MNRILSQKSIYTVLPRKFAYFLVVCSAIFVTSFAHASNPSLCALIFSGQVDSATPSRLLLKESWVSTRSEPEIYEKRGLEWTANDYVASEKIRYQSRDYDSLSQSIEVERGALMAVSLDPSPAELAYMRRNFRGGTPASVSERATKRADLEQILDFSAGFWKHAKEISDRFGEDRVRTIFMDILRETAERTINFLVADGVLVDVSKNEHGFLSSRILPEGNHKLNRRAAEVESEYDGVTLWYRLSMDARGSYSGRMTDLHLSEPVLLTLDPKHGVIGHELRHARNDLDGSRDFGSAIAKKGSNLPGKKYAYDKFQSFEEAETHSYSLRRDAQELLRMIQKGDLEKTEYFEYHLLNQAFQSSIVAERNSIVTGLLDTALREGVEPKIEYDRVRIGGENKYIATFELIHDGKPFEYQFVIHDSSARTKGEQIAYIRSRVDEMIRLNPNYEVQFRVTEQATELLLAATTAREKAAILEGIISITRPHFWESGNFVVVRETDLIQRFNSVVSDRWVRFSNLPN
ncbi:MAG: hypothetical protein KDD22_02935 [Bdellovibrionales bacterium]|nr:hypothetical protein [Bdellovibrionales bacterium]